MLEHYWVMSLRRNCARMVFLFCSIMLCVPSLAHSSTTLTTPTTISQKSSHLLSSMSTSIPKHSSSSQKERTSTSKIGSSTISKSSLKINTILTAGTKMKNEWIFDSWSSKEFVYLFQIKVSPTILLLIYPPDDPTTHCPFGKGNTFAIRDVESSMKLNISCLYDGRISTPYHYMTMQVTICEYPDATLIPELTGKPVSLMVNGKIAQSTAVFKGLPPMPSQTHHISRGSHSPSSGGMTTTRIPATTLTPKKKYKLCACLGMYYRTELLFSWLQYHYWLGLEYTMIYDNDSGVDQLADMIEYLSQMFNIKGVNWPYQRSQYAMNAHCLLHLEEDCEWVMMIDIDEYLRLGPDYKSYSEVLDKYSNEAGAEALSYFFYPSGYIDQTPDGGLIKNYGCRKTELIYHSKSIVRPDRLHKSKYNMVHSYCFEKKYAQSKKFPTGELLLYHYKYIAWPIFSRKFMRRFATNFVYAETGDDMDKLKARYITDYAPICPTVDYTLANRFFCAMTVRASPACPAAKVRGAPTGTNSILVTGVNDSGLKLLKKIFAVGSVGTGPQASDIDLGDYVLSHQTSADHEGPDFLWDLGKASAHGDDKRYDRVIHLVEHPLRAIRHIIKSYTDADWKHVTEATPIVKPEYSGLKRALYHWVSWNQWIETYSTDRLSVTLTSFANVCFSIGYSETACSKLPKRVRFKCDLGAGMLSWDDLDVVDSFVSGLAKNMTLQYGFELQNCP